MILAGELLALAEQFLEARMHPVVIIQAYRLALDDAISILKDQLRSVAYMLRSWVLEQKIDWGLDLVPSVPTISLTVPYISHYSSLPVDK